MDRAGSLHVGDQPAYDPEKPTDYNDLGVERVHAANQTPGAAGAETEGNGLPLSKKRITPLDKKTEGGSVPKLALSSDTDGSAIRLSSTLNEAGTCISVPFRSNTIPSKEDMVARLGAEWRFSSESPVDFGLPRCRLERRLTVRLLQGALRSSMGVRQTPHSLLDRSRDRLATQEGPRCQIKW